MPRVPLNCQRRRENLGRSPRRPIPTNSLPPTLFNINHQRPTLLQTIPITTGGRTFHATQAPEPNQHPHSWLELSLQGQALSFSAEVEGRHVVILVQKQTFLAHVVSEGMRLAMETYNNHLWLSTVLQPPLSLLFPQIPFYHHPTCEMPLFNPFNPVATVEPILFPLLCFPHQVPEASMYP
ncbi:hypothetical protein KY284_001489 [Solanum tuberosum]|nr:hypothetical protein KY284_001489 [Solanum tuberosum]